MSSHNTVSLIRIKFPEYPIRIWLSSLSLSLIIQKENFGCPQSFLDQRKRLLQDSRVQSRFPGTRTIPSTQWCGECQSERAPALRENAFWCCVLDRIERDTAGIVRRNERMKGVRGRPKADHKAQCNQGWDEQTNQPRVWANAENWALNQVSWQGKDDSSVPLDNSSNGLPFYGRILQLWTMTNQQRPESTFEQRNR